MIINAICIVYKVYKNEWFTLSLINAILILSLDIINLCFFSINFISNLYEAFMYSWYTF